MKIHCRSKGAVSTHHLHQPKQPMLAFRIKQTSKNTLKKTLQNTQNTYKNTNTHSMNTL